MPNATYSKTFLRIRPATREKYDRVAAAKRWKLATIADAAVDALIKSDPELRKFRRSALTA